MLLLFSNMFYMLVRYVIPIGPICLTCLMLILSVPVDVLYCLLDLCCGECFCYFLLCVFLSMCILCLTVLVNCLLNAFAICVGEVIVVSLTVIVLFSVVFFFVG